MKALIVSMTMALMFGIVGTAHADLVNRGMGSSIHGDFSFIYDTDFDITWFDYSNDAESWDNQLAWASGLEVVFNGEVFKDWRLPSSLNSDGSGPCEGPDCTDSEMGHLYYTELGNDGSWSLLTGPFENLYNEWYWSENGDAGNDPQGHAWGFIFKGWYSAGEQLQFTKSGEIYALAVMEGDIAQAPIPSAIWLLGSGLIGFVGARRKFKKS